jgi:hypothetical protein
VTEVRLWPARCHDFGRRFTGLSVIEQSKEVHISFFVCGATAQLGPRPPRC